MTFPAPFLKMSFLFAVGGTAEEAQTSVSFSSGATAAEMQSLVDGMGDTFGDQIESRMTTLLGTSALNWADYSDFVGTKVAAIDTDGAYLGDPFVHEKDSVSSGSASNTPPQCSVTITLFSGSTFGKGNFGRFYLPHTTMDLASGEPRASTADALAIATAGRVFLNNLASDLSTEDGTYSWGTIIASETVSGGFKVPSFIRCGRVVDTQRRRRGQLDEDPQSYAY